MQQRDNSVENMVQIQEAVLRLMDRFDETAEEINNWCSNRQIRLDRKHGYRQCFLLS
jgi:hypothetical protein